MSNTRHVKCCRCDASVLVSANASGEGQLCNDCLDKRRARSQRAKLAWLKRTDYNAWYRQEVAGYGPDEWIG